MAAKQNQTVPATPEENANQTPDTGADQTPDTGADQTPAPQAVPEPDALELLLNKVPEGYASLASETVSTIRGIDTELGFINKEVSDLKAKRRKFLGLLQSLAE